MRIVLVKTVLVLGLVAGLVTLVGAATPTFWQVSTQSELLRGEVENLSIDIHGRLVLGPATDLVYESTAPFLWSLRRPNLRTVQWDHVVEVVALFIALTITCVVAVRTQEQLLFLVLPLLGWIAWRFQQRGAAPAALLVSVLVIGAAADDMGPFDGESLLAQMMLLQIFNASAAFTALLFAEIASSAGVPPGVLNIVTGDGETGKLIVDHSNIDKIAFTGSTEVGRIIQRKLAGTQKKYTLELGGKAANIIFADAALDQAVEGIVNAIFFNQGHVCCAGSRLLVQESVADEVITRLKDRMETLIVGDPLDKNTDIGAINSAAQLEKIEDYLRIGQSEGAEFYQSSCSLPEKGYWCRPTLFTGVSQSNRIVKEEIFGPVLTIQTFRTFQEALEKANNTPYGLSGGVWTDKGAKIFKMTRNIRAGVIWANTFNKFDPTSPFGGYKESGMGREGGLHGLAAYVELR